MWGLATQFGGHLDKSGRLFCDPYPGDHSCASREAQESGGASFQTSSQEPGTPELRDCLEALGRGDHGMPCLKYLSIASPRWPGFYNLEDQTIGQVLLNLNMFQITFGRKRVNENEDLKTNVRDVM